MIQSNVTIGDDVIMGPDVKIYSRNHVFDDPDRPIAVQGKRFLTTSVGDDVWIGANVVILAGVKIGAHCVIGAGAVVTRDVPEWSIAAGNPARVIRDRRDHARNT